MTEDKVEKVRLIDFYPELAAKVARSLKIKKKEIPLVRKFIPFERDVEVTKDKKGQTIVVSYISTSAIDRDKEVLNPDGVDLENYRKNPVVMWAHDYGQMPVGKNLWIKPDAVGLKAGTLFANSERGKEVERGFTEDMDGTGPLLRGFSVGFIPKKWKDKDEIIAEAEKSGEKIDKDALPERIYTEWELLEYSAVPIPSCPEALLLAQERGIISKDFAATFETVPISTEALHKLVEEIDEKDTPKKIEEIEKSEIKESVSDSDDIRREEADEEKPEADAVTKPETTEDFHHVPVRSAGDFVDDSFRTIDISKAQGIKAVIGKLTSDPNGSTVIQKYLFDVDKWTMAEAKKWVKDNKALIDDGTHGVFVRVVDASSTDEKVFQKTEIHIEEPDEKDKLTATIKIADMEGFQEIIRGLKDDIAGVKEGRVLNTKIRKLISDSVTNMEELTESFRKLLSETEPKPPVEEVNSEVDDGKLAEAIREKIKKSDIPLTPEEIKEHATPEKVKAIVEASLKEYLAKRKGAIE